jgi:hypothetical protein
MPQTKEVPRLTQLESGRIAVAIIKNPVDYSAVMNRAFGRVGSDECARRTRRGVGGPAYLRDRSRFAPEGFYKTRKPNRKTVSNLFFVTHSPARTLGVPSAAVLTRLPLAGANLAPGCAASGKKRIT